VLNYAGFISQAGDDLETCSSCIIHGLKFVSCPKVLKYEAGRQTGRAASRFRRGELTINFTVAQTNSWPLLEVWMCRSL